MASFHELPVNRIRSGEETEDRDAAVSPPSFPIVRGRALRGARKLKKRLVGASEFEPEPPASESSQGSDVGSI